MIRRDFLKLIGVAAVAPALIVKEHALAGPIFDGEIIPTDFPIIDKALKGGFRKGNLHTIHGDEPQMFGESLAMRLGKKASVALITPFNHCCNASFSSYDGNVFVFPVNRPAFSSSMICNAMRTHDVVVIMNDGVFDHNDTRIFRQMALEENCVLVFVYFSHKLFAPSFSQYLWSDCVLCVQDQKRPDVFYDEQYRSCFGSLYTISMTKNRFGINHVVEPVVLYDGQGFQVITDPHSESNYWSYNQDNGIVLGTYGELMGISDGLSRTVTTLPYEGKEVKLLVPKECQ